MISRRKFMKLGLGAVAGAGTLLTESGKIIAAAPENGSDTRYAFLVDTHKCVGCGFCVKACKIENEIPFEANASRTWVERYVVMKDGSVYGDSPQAAINGFTSPVISGYVTNEEGKVVLPHGGHDEELKPLIPDESEIAKTFFVPKLCNQCDKPACVQVCPVGATYQTADGVVLVDRTWCIGCGYCIMACPYGVRFFHPVVKTAEKCTWCYHRITKGMKPACVDACAFGARDIGNIKDLNDPVTKIIKTERVQVLKPDYGTGPQAYYLGLDHEVR